jgi:hypothetical protein
VVFGILAGGVSLGQGNSPSVAGTHATIAFAVAAVTLILIKLTKGLLIWLMITALGVGALYFVRGLGR